MDDSFAETVRAPSREDVDQLKGFVLLEFGAQWCGHCAILRPHLTRLLKEFPQVRHVRIEDGKGQPLGRSFQVKLWPTLIFMADGKIVRRAVRPSPEEADAAFQALFPDGPTIA
jgi:thioredoxin 1